VAFKSNGPRPGIFVPSHHPGSKEVTQTKDRLQGNNCFDGVGRIVTQLPVDGIIGEGQRNVTLLSAAIVQRWAIGIEGHCDGKRWNVDSISKNAKITRQADICASIHKGPIRWFYLYVWVAVIADTKYPGHHNYPNNTGWQ
jgi:hypothetical protein